MENDQSGAVESSRRPDAAKTAPSTPPIPPEPAAESKKEVGGRGGLEPTRYGDWEVKGIASDF